MNRWLVGALFGIGVALALIAAGCGSGGSDTTATVALTKAQFISKADTICARIDVAQEIGLKSYSAGGKFPTTVAEQEKMVGAVGLPPVRRGIEELEELGVPREKQAEEILEGMKVAIGKAEENPGSVVTGVGNPFIGVNKQARAYGFKACSDPL